jgi:diadenosine tetraphosphate (Ap4A) HIT family hydrolase
MSGTDDAGRDAFLARLPYGEALPLDRVIDSDLFPFTGEIVTRPLERPVIPEPARRGIGGVDCFACTDRASGVIWRNERWHVRAGSDPSGLPLVCVLMPNAHHDLDDLPAGLAAELGPMMQRVSRALGSLPAVGRVHVNRWGDGSEHFHLWFLPRPLGMWQLRGAMLAIWDDLLPLIPRDEWLANRHAVALALAADDGEVVATD